MRVIRKLSVVVALALLAGACAGDDGDGGTAAPPAGEPGAPQELRIAAGADEYTLQGPRANLGQYPINTNIFETLTYLSPDYEVRPLLAERWEFRAPNTWRFFLRRGVRFHDGQPFNAAAVKSGLFDRVAQQPGGATIKAGPASAVVVDAFTIDFTPTAPNFRVPEQIVHPQNGVLAPGSDITKKPVGTGPFRFVEYLPKERIVVERNPDYWGPRAKASRLTFRFLPDGNARRLALEAGDVDLAFPISGPDVKALQSRGFDVEKPPVGSYEAMYANIHGAPPHDLLQDAAVRKAIALGIDRRQLVNSVLEGQATTDQTMIPPKALGSHAGMIQGSPYDPARARSTLDGAGWRAGPLGIRAKGGRRLRLSLVSGFGGAEIHKPIPTFLQAQLKDIGVELDIVERPDSASYQALIDSGAGDLFLERGSQNDANPGFLPVLLFYTGGTGATATYQKLFAPGPAFDQVLTPALTEVDTDKVRRIVAEAMHEIIDVQNVVIPLAGIFPIYGMKKAVQGFVPHPSSLNVRWEGAGLGSSE